MSMTRIDEASDAYLETFALLQEEIARLEAELRLRDESPAEASPAPGDRRENEAAEARVAELTALLAERDETIGLLWDQLAALEEAGSARAAEWEQLSRWVEELEARIEGGDTRSPDPDAGFREAEALRERLGSEQRAWEAERARLEQEVSVLRNRLAEASAQFGDQAHTALEDENRRLRDECRRLAVLGAEAASVGVLRNRTRELEAELEQAREASDHAADELHRLRLEHEAELAALRVTLTGTKVAVTPESSPDERIRALRLHYREVHEREEKERQERQLSSRLSRLWRRSGPRR